MLTENKFDAVFVGLGYIGLPTAAFVASKELKVCEKGEQERKKMRICSFIDYEFCYY